VQTQPRAPAPDGGAGAPASGCYVLAVIELFATIDLSNIHCLIEEESRLLNRIATGAIAVSLAAALPAMSVSAKPAGGPPKAVNTVHPPRIGSAIDVTSAVSSGVSADVLELALTAMSCAAASGAIEPPPTLTLIDYSRPSIEPRLWVFDLASGKLLFKELVAHGRNTGENFATQFSNEMDSRQTSLGLFVTDEPYVGSNGYSLRLDGLDAGFNDRARERAIVMHGAPYVDAQLAAAQGRIGRSWGCPALRTAIASKVIDRIRGGGVIFSYYPDKDWLETSRFLQGCGQS
jgi:L,D-transpeptidase catalytic domain